jgi:hypothetical protein
MQKNTAMHNFHIPVMGLAFTIDSPIRVAQFGISSVISIMDDDLMEKMNAYYSKKFNFPYHEISQKTHDYRAKRITSYLNLVNTIVTEKFNLFKAELAGTKTALENFTAMLPRKSKIKTALESLLQEARFPSEAIADYCEKYLVAGAIDVNIMTKVDRENFEKNSPLPVEFNDAHAALRGFANSVLSSSVVLSAGMNPRLYGYFESFPDFFPDENFILKKKITIKVSDFRSAMIQGNFFAKKGLWVSEFRIESGLNCGGHAFATDGTLMGPILEEFKQKKEALISGMHDLLCKALLQKSLPVPEVPLQLKITVQGGVGTAEEHNFLITHYNTDSVGWGSPFLLVPEATSVDAPTRELLANAVEKDLYTSNISPLGVPFNTVRGTTNEILRRKRIDEQKPGSACPKKYLALNTEYGNKGICTASRKFQEIKLAELQNENITPEEHNNRKDAITEKSCLCVGLSNASLLENDIKIKGDHGVLVCPGPNIAYFGQQYSLKEMVTHIYGGASLLEGVQRPNLFLKELTLYLQLLSKAKMAEPTTMPEKQMIKLRDNLLAGTHYYKTLFLSVPSFQKNIKTNLKALESIESELDAILN